MQTSKIWEMPDGKIWIQDESGYWENPELNKPTGAIITIVVVLALGIWFMIWSKHTGINTGHTGNYLPSCISYFAAHHFQEPPNFGVFCY